MGSSGVASDCSAISIGDGGRQLRHRRAQFETRARRHGCVSATASGAMRIQTTSLTAAASSATARWRPLRRCRPDRLYLNAHPRSLLSRHAICSGDARSAWRRRRQQFHLPSPSPETPTAAVPGKKSLAHRPHLRWQHGSAGNIGKSKIKIRLESRRHRCGGGSTPKSSEARVRLSYPSPIWLDTRSQTSFPSLSNAAGMHLSLRMRLPLKSGSATKIRTIRSIRS